MNVHPFVPECLRRPGPVCLAGLALWALVSISFATARAVEEEAKDTRGVTTVGPPVTLSAAQQAKLAAKRAATIIPVPRAEVVPVKPAPISTIPAPATGGPDAIVSLKATPTAKAGSASKPTTIDATTADQNDAAIDAFISALGPELARRIGLIKPGDNGSALRATTPRPASGGAR